MNTHVSETTLLLKKLIDCVDETVLVHVALKGTLRGIENAVPKVEQAPAPKIISCAEHKTVCQSMPMLNTNNNGCVLYTLSFFKKGDVMRVVGSDGIVDMTKLGAPYMHWSPIVSFASLDASLNPMKLDGMLGSTAQLMLEQVLTTNAKTQCQFVTDAAKLQSEECKLGMVLVYLKDVLDGLKKAETEKFDIVVCVKPK